MATFFTIGPSELYPTVKNHIKTALDQDILSLSHRSSKFFEIYEEISANLKKLLEIPDNYKVLFYGSATECMERLIQSCVEKNSYHFVCGAFSKRFYNISSDYKKNPYSQQISIKDDEWFDFQNFSKDITKENLPEMFCITQNETSTGVKIDLEDIYSLKENFPESLIAVDAVSSLPIYEVNFQKIDALFFSIQKVFGLPSGLGVLVVGPKVLEKAEKLSLKSKDYSQGSYFSLAKMLEQSLMWQTPHTPNVLAIYLFNQVLKDFLNYGLPKIVAENKVKSDLIYSFFDKHDYLKPLVKNLEIRSDTTICINTPFDSTKLLDYLKTKDLIVSSGYGQSQKQQIRIANFPASGREQICELLENIENFDEFS